MVAEVNAEVAHVMVVLEAEREEAVAEVAVMVEVVKAAEEETVIQAEEEINRAPEFDVVVVNDDLDLAIEQVATQIKQFLD